LFTTAMDMLNHLLAFASRPLHGPQTEDLYGAHGACRGLIRV
jgi:hypothetical protein